MASRLFWLIVPVLFAVSLTELVSTEIEFVSLSESLEAQNKSVSTKRNPIKSSESLEQQNKSVSTKRSPIKSSESLEARNKSVSTKGSPIKSYRQFQRQFDSGTGKPIRGGSLKGLGDATELIIFDKSLLENEKGLSDPKAIEMILNIQKLMVANFDELDQHLTYFEQNLNRKIGSVQQTGRPGGDTSSGWKNALHRVNERLTGSLNEFEQRLEHKIDHLDMNLKMALSNIKGSVDYTAYQEDYWWQARKG